MPRRFTPGNIHGTQCVGGLVDPRLVGTRAENLAPHRDSIPDPSTP